MTYPHSIRYIHPGRPPTEAEKFEVEHPSLAVPMDDDERLLAKRLMAYRQLRQVMGEESYIV